MPLDIASSRPHLHPPALSGAATGSRLVVAGVSGGRELQRRLTEMGLPRGAEFEVVGRMGRHGAVIVSIHGTRVVIGAGMADKIQVASAGVPA
ncbi:MAG: FeoA family protein [Pseudomonadota bacterium]